MSKMQSGIKPADAGEPMSLIVIVAGLPPEEARFARGALEFTDRGHEVIFCADGVGETPRILSNEIAARASPARVVFGPEAKGPNPKVDMMATGIDAARHDIVVCLDGNAVIPGDLDARIAGAVKSDAFVISTAPLAADGEGLWGGMEQALINRIYGRWCIAGEAMGVPIVFGKLLAFRKSWLAAAGGLARLRGAAAEDTALARLARSTGAKISHVWPPLQTSLSGRSRDVILDRTGRWMQLRRRDVPLVYLAEGFLGLWSLLLAGCATAALLGCNPVVAGAAIFGSWHLCEALLARSSPGGWRSAIHAHAILRDLVYPVLWLRNLFPARYRWRAPPAP